MIKVDFIRRDKGFKSSLPYKDVKCAISLNVKT
jgi:hypothetical protein